MSSPTARACAVPPLCLCCPVPFHIPMERKQALCSSSSTNQMGGGRVRPWLAPALCHLDSAGSQAGNIGQHSGFPVRLGLWRGAGTGQEACSRQQEAGRCAARHSCALETRVMLPAVHRERLRPEQRLPWGWMRPRGCRASALRDGSKAMLGGFSPQCGMQPSGCPEDAAGTGPSCGTSSDDRTPLGRRLC